VTETGEKLKPVDDVGGGVNDILSLGNMIAFWCLNPNRPLMFWDEPTKHLSREYSEAAGNMLKTLVEEKELQILMVSHDRKLAEVSNNIIEL
jgi:ABC-type lipoprotein export system ATPase subunit